jgi:hypothetical protein
MSISRQAALVSFLTLLMISVAAAAEFGPLYVRGDKAASAPPKARGIVPVITGVGYRAEVGKAIALRFAFDRALPMDQIHFRLYADTDCNTETGRKDKSVHRGTDFFVTVDAGALKLSAYKANGKKRHDLKVVMKVEKDALCFTIPAKPVAEDKHHRVRLYATLWVGESRKGTMRVGWATMTTMPVMTDEERALANAPKADFDIPKNFRALDCTQQNLPRTYKPEPYTAAELAIYQRLFPSSLAKPIFHTTFAKSMSGMVTDTCGLKATLAKRKGSNGQALKLHGPRRKLEGAERIHLPPVTLQPKTLYEMKVRFHSKGALYFTVRDDGNPWKARITGVYVDATYGDGWRVGNFVFPHYGDKPAKIQFTISMIYQLDDFLGPTYDLPKEGEVEVWLDEIRVDRLGAMPASMAQAGEFAPYHDLDTHVSRGMIKPNKRLQRPDGSFPGERLDFVDTITGTRIRKMTHDMHDAWHSYPNCLPWNSSGDRFIISSIRPLLDPSSGSYRNGVKFIMGADGSFIRYLTPGEYKWDIDRPNILYRRNRKDRSAINAVEVDPKTGRIIKDWTWLKVAPYGSMCRLGMLGPQHPVTKKLLIKEAYIRGTERGSRWFAVDPPKEIPADPDAPPAVLAPKPIIHLPFTTNQFYWTKDEFDGFEFNFNPTDPHYDNPKAGREGQYRVDWRNKKLYRFCKVHGSHRSYELPGGGRRMARVSSGLLVRDMMTDDERCIFPRPPNPYGITDAHTDWSSYDGTLGSSLGTSYFLADMKPWPRKSTDSIDGVRGWTSNLHHFAVMGQRNRMYRAEAHAALSPDGTKVAYMSNMTGQVEVYHGLIRRPRTPKNVRVATSGGGVKLTWQRPEYGREITGYLVFGSKESGRGYQLLTPKPIVAASYLSRVGRASAMFYVVASVEGSGMVSVFSEEVTLNTTSHRRLFFGVLEGVPFDGAARRLDGSASEYAAFGLSAFHDRGATLLKLRVPRDGDYRIFARVRREKSSAPQRGSAALSWSVNAKRINTIAVTASEYDWVQLAFQPRTLRKGNADLWLLPSGIRVLVDEICLTDDAAFVPKGSGRLITVPPSAPTGLQARATDSFTSELKWQPSADPMISHYNIYAAGGKDFLAGRAIGLPIVQANRHRLATTLESTRIDWGLKPGIEYRYRVAAVSRFDAEGPLSGEVIVRTPPLKSVRIKIPFKGWSRPCNFSVPRDGNYILWAKVRSLETSRLGRKKYSRVRMNVAIKGGPKCVWRPRFDFVSMGHSGPIPDRPFWDRISLGNREEFPVFEIAKGKSVITISKPGTYKMVVEELFLTNDQSIAPDGVVNFIVRKP